MVTQDHPYSAIKKNRIKVGFTICFCVLHNVSDFLCKLKNWSGTHSLHFEEYLNKTTKVSLNTSTVNIATCTTCNLREMQKPTLCVN